MGAGGERRSWTANDFPPVAKVHYSRVLSHGPGHAGVHRERQTLCHVPDHRENGGSTRCCHPEIASSGVRDGRGQLCESSIHGASASNRNEVDEPRGSAASSKGTVVKDEAQCTNSERRALLQQRLSELRSSTLQQPVQEERWLLQSRRERSVKEIWKAPKVHLDQQRQLDHEERQRQRQVERFGKEPMRAKYGPGSSAGGLVPASGKEQQASTSFNSTVRSAKTESVEDIMDHVKACLLNQRGQLSETERVRGFWNGCKDSGEVF